MKPSNIRKIQINIIRAYDESLIDGIYYSAISSQSSLEKKLNKRVEEIESNISLSDDDKHFEMEYLNDKYYGSRLIKELSEEMVIIALFKTVEIAIKKMLERSELFTDDELRQFFRVKELLSQVKNKIVDLKTLQGFTSYDELRCINNSIKHEGVVGKELAAFSSWTLGKKISDLWNHYERLKPGVRRFIYNLSDNIVTKIN